MGRLFWCLIGAVIAAFLPWSAVYGPDFRILVWDSLASYAQRLLQALLSHKLTINTLTHHTYMLGGAVSAALYVIALVALLYAAANESFAVRGQWMKSAVLAGVCMLLSTAAWYLLVNPPTTPTPLGTPAPGIGLVIAVIDAVVILATAKTPTYY